jgi:hypothetical protein
VQRHDLTRQTVPRNAAIAERLHALDGDADCIGVVPVRRVAFAGEARFDPLEPPYRLAGTDPVTRAVAAQTSKTDDLAVG